MCFPTISSFFVTNISRIMEALHTLIENHYHTPGLLEDITKRLEEQEVDMDHVYRGHIAGVDEFHVRGAKVSRELANEAGLLGSSVLDVGCGLGGPSRMLAAEYCCNVTGIDLSHEYIRTAKGLSELVGLHDKTEYIQSNALDLPFEKGSFDAVWTQHVQMNIRNKSKFYAEIERVLRSRGWFIYYDILSTDSGEISYPVPWANDASVSFLGTGKDMNNTLERIGFERILTNDQTKKGIHFLKGLFEKLKINGPPPLGLNVLMGTSTKTKLVNILNGLVEEKIVLQSGIYKKVA